MTLRPQAPLAAAALPILPGGPTRAELMLPPAPAGLRIGLYGGSFNPLHEGHHLVAGTARRRLGLDAVWWLVTPGNPLKAHAGPRPVIERLRAIANAPERHPADRVLAFECLLDTRYTADTVRTILAMRPGVRFVWLMGADSLAGFHRWRHWRRLAKLVPIAVVDRPEHALASSSAPLARWLASSQIPASQARRLPDVSPPAWTMLRGPRTGASSTALRILEPPVS